MSCVDSLDVAASPCPTCLGSTRVIIRPSTPPGTCETVPVAATDERGTACPTCTGRPEVDAPEPFDPPPDCNCAGTGLVIACHDSGSGYFIPGYVDSYGNAHGEDCCCVEARAEYEESVTCAHCGEHRRLVVAITKDERVCADCAAVSPDARAIVATSQLVTSALKTMRLPYGVLLSRLDKAHADATFLGLERAV